MIPPERVKELREWLIENEYTKIDGIEIPSLRVRQMLDILDDYSALKAENEELRLREKYPDPEDMPGELAAKFCPFNDELHFHHDGCPSEWAMEERVKKAEARLAKRGLDLNLVERKESYHD